MKEVLVTIYIVLFCITQVSVVYYALMSLVGFFSRKQKYAIVKDEKKFCIFVPCHNEGPVVAATVRNHSKINYDKKLYSIYFIADNCSDDTAKILRETIEECKCENFFVLERKVNDPKKKGKPHALRWGIEQLEAKDEFYSKYDFFMVFDADNFVDADILKHINSQYLSYKENKRPVMIQAYLDSKNKNSLVARSYYTGYRVSNRIAQMARHDLKLVPAIGGTGFAMTTEFLKDIGGYKCNSLTEDLEIQTIATVKGKSIIFNNRARVYDEKPTGFKQAVVQRTRWAQGHWYLAFKYIPVLFIQLFNFKTIKNFFRKFDLIIYLLSKFFVFCSVLMLLMSLYFLIFAPQAIAFPPYVNIISICVLALSIIAIPLTSLLDGGKEERRKILIEFIPNVISLYLMTLLEMIASLRGLFKCGNQKVWKKTAHKVTQMDAQTEITETSNNI